MARIEYTYWPDIIEGRWVKIGESPNRGGSPNYIDRESLVRDQGNGGSAWVRIYYQDHGYAVEELECLCRSWKECSAAGFLDTRAA